jgi:hypothetical protein
MKEDVDIQEKKRDEVWEKLKKEFEKHEFDSSQYIDYVMVGCRGGMRVEARLERLFHVDKGHYIEAIVSVLGWWAKSRVVIQGGEIDVCVNYPERVTHYYRALMSGLLAAYKDELEEAWGL